MEATELYQVFAVFNGMRFSCLICFTDQNDSQKDPISGLRMMWNNNNNNG
jgi:hypothetical protein